MNEISLDGTVYDFSTDYSLTDIKNILNINDCLIKKHNTNVN